MQSEFDLMQHDLLTAQVEYQMVRVKSNPWYNLPIKPIVLLVVWIPYRTVCKLGLINRCFLLSSFSLIATSIFLALFTLRM